MTTTTTKIEARAETFFRQIEERRELRTDEERAELSRRYEELFPDEED
jgi:hypothetical protein